MKRYNIGWDILITDPNRFDAWYCCICGTQCDVQRNLFGHTYKHDVSPKRFYDKFTCPNTGKKWHDQAYELHMAIEDTPSDSLKELMQQDLATLLLSHSSEGAKS